MNINFSFSGFKTKGIFHNIRTFDTFDTFDSTL